MLKILNDDGRVAGGVPSALADRKEWAAALAWVDSNKPVSMADLKSLSKTERETLCAILGSTVGRRDLATCNSILAGLAEGADGGDGSFSSFMQILEDHDKESSDSVKTWSKQKLQQSLQNAPPGLLAGAPSIADLRERYAFLQWAAVAGDPQDFNDLSPALRDLAYGFLGVPSGSDDMRANVAAVMSGKKLAGAGQSSRGTVAGSANGGGGGGGGGSATPNSVFQIRAPPSARRGGRADGSSAMQIDPEPLLGGSSLWDSPLIDYGSLPAGSRERVVLDETRAKYVSLRTSWFNLVPKDELKSVRQLSSSQAIDLRLRCMHASIVLGLGASVWQLRRHRVSRRIARAEPL